MLPSSGPSRLSSTLGRPQRGSTPAWAAPSVTWASPRDAWAPGARRRENAPLVFVPVAHFWPAPCLPLSPTASTSDLLLHLPHFACCLDCAFAAAVHACSAPPPLRRSPQQSVRNCPFWTFHHPDLRSPFLPLTHADVSHRRLSRPTPRTPAPVSLGRPSRSE